MQYMNQLDAEDGVLENYIQGAMWRKKRSIYAENDVVLPLYIDFDDLEVNNLVGSHAGIAKLCPVYVSLACLPPEYASCLENIFVTLMFHSIDREEFGNAKVFKCLVDELNYFSESGIFVKTEFGQETRVYFVLAGISSDNLSFYPILGFIKGFNANHNCRFCKNDKKGCQHNTIISQKLRKKEDYITDVRPYSSDSGVVENSVWNKVTYFHVYENYFTDILHDLDEGVSKYDM